MKNHSVAFYVRKGGSAKTTSVFNVAGVLARRGKKVFVLDLDAQGDAARLLSANAPEKPKKTV